MNTFHRTLLLTACTLTAVCLSDIALAQAAQDISQVANTAKRQIPALGQLAVWGAYLAGALFVISGLMKWKQSAQNPQVQAKEYLMSMGIGAALLTVTVIMDISTRSTIGTTATGKGTLQLESNQ